MECVFKEAIEQAYDINKVSWCIVDVVGDEDELLERHVLPANDIDGHQDGLTCHCGPDIQYKDPETGKSYGGAVIVVHKAFDGRHLVEQANKILNGS